MLGVQWFVVTISTDQYSYLELCVSQVTSDGDTSLRDILPPATSQPPSTCWHPRPTLPPHLSLCPLTDPLWLEPGLKENGQWAHALHGILAVVPAPGHF